MRDLSNLTNEYGLIRRPRERNAEKRVSAARQAGTHVGLLPGVTCLATSRCDFATRVHAVRLWQPNAVIAGLAAAKLTFWPSAPASTIDLIYESKARPWAGFELHRGEVPEEGITYLGPLRLTTPAWTAVWLSAWDQGQALEVALRQGVTVAEMNRALRSMNGWRGNPTRRAVVKRSQHAPWSTLERRMHEILDDAGISGWLGNWWYQPGNGEPGWPIDIAFLAQRLAIEVDGYEFHSDRRTWQRDRMKGNHLVLNGWILLRFTWDDLADPARVVAIIREALALGAQMNQS